MEEEQYSYTSSQSVNTHAHLWLCRSTQIHRNTNLEAACTKTEETGTTIMLTGYLWIPQHQPQPRILIAITLMQRLFLYGLSHKSRCFLVEDAERLPLGFTATENIKASLKFEAMH